MMYFYEFAVIVLELGLIKGYDDDNGMKGFDCNRRIGKLLLIGKITFW